MTRRTFIGNVARMLLANLSLHYVYNDILKQTVELNNPKTVFEDCRRVYVALG